MTTEIYLDANATSPVLPAAILAAQAALLQCFGNPSSSHAAGLRARVLLDDARSRARRVLGAATGRLMFTSGATEGIQTAVLSALCAVRERRAAGLPCGDLLLYGATEHKAVPESLAHWNALLGTGLTLQALPVDADGRHRLDILRTLAPRTAFLCTMAANNETGVVSDLDGIAAVLGDTGSEALWMVDCVQALGKLPLALDHTRIDYAPFSGHKLYAPKGIGMLWVRPDAPYTPLMCGGGQEAGQRSGTENMAGIAALGAVPACARPFPASRSTPLSNTRCRPRSIFPFPTARARRCSTCSTPPACASARVPPVRPRRRRRAMCCWRWGCRKCAVRMRCACPSGRWPTTPSSTKPAPASRAVARPCWRRHRRHAR
jgi:cysteine sulfinate desulfinase/cysteine desulfurase-like protein